MKTSTIILVFMCMLSLFGCKHSQAVAGGNSDTSKQPKENQQVAVKEDTVSGRDTTDNLNLNYGFTIMAGKIRRHNGYNTFFELWQNSKKLFVDTVNNFEFKDQPPILNKLRAGVFELLVEFDNNPNKNLTLLLRIEQDKVVRTDTLPTFTKKPEHIKGMVVQSGPWDNSEEWDEKGIRYISFDPVLYYKFTPDGVRLDSALTRERTRLTYGNVDPFDHAEQIGFPIDGKNHIDTVAKHVYRKKIED